MAQGPTNLQGLNTYLSLQGGGGGGGGVDLSGAFSMGANAASGPQDDDTDTGDSSGLAGMSPLIAQLTKQQMQGIGREPLNSEDKGLALAQAGFAMAAGNSPHPLVNLGEGAVSGISALQKLQQERALQRMRSAQVLQTAIYHQDETQQRTAIAAQASKDRLAAIQERADAARQRSQDLNASLDQRKQAADELAQYRNDMLDLRRGAGGANLPEGTGDAFLEQLPSGDQAIVKKVVAGEVDPRSLSARDGYRNRIIAAASQYDDAYDQTNLTARVKARAAWAPGGSVGVSNNALDTVVGHIGNLSKDVDQLDNFGGYATILNAPKNWANKKAGETAVTNFNTDADAVATELAKAYKGAGALAEGQIKEWRSNLDPNMSTPQLKGSIDHVLGLLDSKADANLKQWNDTMGARNQRDPTAIYGEKSRAVLAKIAPDRYGALVPGGASPAPAPVPAPDAATAAPPAPPASDRVKGTRYTTPKGPMTWTGTGWVP